MPVVGQATDYFGRKWITVILSAMGVVGPIVISRSQSMSTVIAGFNLLGPAMATQATTFAIPSEIVPRQHRALAQAAINISTGAGAIVAFIMGGALLRENHLENYRIYWYVAAGLYFLGCLGVLLGYRPPPRELQVSLTVLEKLQKLDFIGLILVGSALALFSMGLQWSGNPYSWGDAHVLGPFIIGIGFLVAFIFYSWRIRSDGFMNHKLFGDRNFALVLALVFLEGLVFFAVNSYLSYEVSVLYDLNLLQSGYRLVVTFAGSMIFAFLAGAFITHTKRLREAAVVGMALFVLAFSLLASIKASTQQWETWLYSLIIGLGLGCVLPTIYVTAQISTPLEMISVATSITSATRSFGGAVGLAVNNALFTDSLTKKIPEKVAAAVLPLDFPVSGLDTLISALISEDEQAVQGVPGITPQTLEAASIAVTNAYIQSFRNAWIAAAAFSASGLIRKFVLSSDYLVYPFPAYTDHVPISRSICS